MTPSPFVGRAADRGTGPSPVLHEFITKNVPFSTEIRGIFLPLIFVISSGSRSSDWEGRCCNFWPKWSQIIVIHFHG